MPESGPVTKAKMVNLFEKRVRKWMLLQKMKEAAEK
jgi:hypothetical protein